MVIGKSEAPEWIWQQPTREIRNDVYRRISPRLPPYEHQRRAVNDAVDGINLHGFHALFMEMGTGKTKTTIDAWAILVGMKKVDTLIVVSPKSLMSTWTDEELPKHTCIDYACLAWDGKGTQKSVQTFEAFMAAKDPKVYVVNIEAFQSLNEELRSRLSKLLRGGKCLMAIDECFAKGTEVDLIVSDGILTTTIKKTKIEDVVPGDTVITAIGPSTVKGTARREIHEAVIVKTTTGSITCSSNHPFFTHRGWIRSKDLRPGDCLSSPEETMRLVRGDFLSKIEGEEWQDPEVLRSQLLGEMEDVAARYKGEDIHKGDSIQDCRGDEVVLRKPSRPGCEEKDEDWSHESNGERGFEEEMLGYSQGNEASTEDSRWEWSWFNSASSRVATLSGILWRWLDPRVRGKNRIEREGVSKRVQDRYSEQGSDDSNRSRWIQSHGFGEAGAGQEKNRYAGVVRVEGVEVLEPTDPRLDGSRDADGKLYFYDLEISGHPSFTVNGVVVHNSSTIKGPDAKRAKNAIAAGRLCAGRMILTGTEISKSPLDLYMQFEFLKPGFWGVRSFFMFKNKFAILQDSYGAGGRIFKKTVGYQKLNELVASIEPYTTRALKDQCLDLPEKVRVKILVDMTPAQENMYAQLKKLLAAELESGEIMTVPNKIALFTKFRQLTGGTMKNCDEYVVVEPNPGKLLALIDDLEDTDEQAIVWCAFRGEVKLVADALSKLGTVVTFDGSTDIDDRSLARVSFQNGEARFFVANMKAGAYGLNLQNCHLQYFYSRDTSPQANWQAEDRSHRPGQKSTCVYKSLIARNTVDERILELIDASSDLRDIVRGMSAEDIVRFV